MSQLHVRAEPGSVAPVVLLPGDPDRATFIAETLLDSPRLYNQHRHLLGYTGRYRGLEVSVQTTGMGCPSMAIVAEEVIRLGARRLVRIGTCGAIAPQVAPGDLVVATASVPNDGTTRQYLGHVPYAPVADFAVTQALRAAAESTGRRTHTGLVQTDDAFYAVSRDDVAAMAGRGVLGVEMEASALFTLGALRGVSTGCMLVVSNHIGDESMLATDQLREAVLDMVTATLDAAVELEGERS
ncbi:MAG TPA: purine-nucleoside phosphorylase [Trueperaceae bacterium]|jgi:purine-nucleoside phosphorylase|nr:purine-nucleoside phosphorylase [Trueperaceae bacterium]